MFTVSSRPASSAPLSVLDGTPNDWRPRGTFGSELEASRHAQKLRDEGGRNGAMPVVRVRDGVRTLLIMQRLRYRD